MDVSVVTCVYNQNPRLFEECARSVKQQSGAVEWIVVDDGSTRSAKVEHSSVVSSAGPEIHTVFISLERNIGLSAARNIGLKRARGKWIVVLDSDDCLASGLTDTLSKLPTSVAAACFEVYYCEGQLFEHRTLGYFESLFNRYAGTALDPFLWYDFYYHGIIARRDLLHSISGYTETLRVGEDQDVLLRSLERISSTQLSFIHQVGYEYRSQATGVCKTLWSLVHKNYAATMLAGAKRRGAPFVDCRLGGTERIDACLIDSYEYKDEQGIWHNFHSWLGKHRSISKLGQRT